MSRAAHLAPVRGSPVKLLDDKPCLHLTRSSSMTRFSAANVMCYNVDWGPGFTLVSRTGPLGPFFAILYLLPQVKKNRFDSRIHLKVSYISWFPFMYFVSGLVTGRWLRAHNRNECGPDVAAGPHLRPCLSARLHFRGAFIYLGSYYLLG